MAKRPGAFAFPAMLTGSAALAFGPWLVRLADVSELASVFWRLGLAAPVLLAAALVRRDLPGRRAWRPLAAAGVLFTIDLAAWHLAITRTTLANATLFANGSSLLLPLWAYLAARAWPGARVLAPLGVAAAGAALLLGQSFRLSPEHLTGDLLCLVAALFYTAYLVVMERVRGGAGALGAVAGATLAAALAALPLALAGGAFWPGDWRPLVMLALGSQVVGQGLIIAAVPHLPPHVSGLALLVQPVIAAAIGWLAYGEALAPAQLVGMALVLVALAWARLTPSRPAASPDAARGTPASPRAGTGPGR